MHAQYFLFNYCCDGHAVEGVDNGLPDFDVVSCLA